MPALALHHRQLAQLVPRDLFNTTAPAPTTGMETAASLALDTLAGQVSNILTNDDHIPRAFLVVKNMPIDAMLIFGPQLVSALFVTTLTAVVMALSGVYYLNFSGKGGDKWFLQLGVAVANIFHIVASAMLVENFYHRIFASLLHPDGWDMRSAGWEIPSITAFEVVPMALGQLYFLARTSKFFIRGKRVFFSIGLVLILVQATIGLASIEVYARTLDWFKILATPSLKERQDVYLDAWAAMHATNELLLCGTLLYKLIRLRSQSDFAAANAVMYKLGLLAIQTNFAQILSVVFMIAAHELSPTGWFLPALMLQQPLYSIFVLINLIYRRSMAAELNEATSQIRMESHAAAAARASSDGVETECHPVCTGFAPDGAAKGVFDGTGWRVVEPRRDYAEWRRADTSGYGGTCKAF